MPLISGQERGVADNARTLSLTASNEKGRTPTTSVGAHVQPEQSRPQPSQPPCPWSSADGHAVGAAAVSGGACFPWCACSEPDRSASCVIAGWEPHAYHAAAVENGVPTATTTIMSKQIVIRCARRICRP